MYTVNYDIRGNVSGIQKGNMSIPIDEHNTDYQDFLTWNSQQQVPLDLETPILLPTEYHLQPEQQIIIANGLHMAIITTSVKYIDPMPKVDTILINDVETEIELTDGIAEIEFSSDVPGTVIKIEYHGLYAIIIAE